MEACDFRRADFGAISLRCVAILRHLCAVNSRYLGISGADAVPFLRPTQWGISRRCWYWCDPFAEPVPISTIQEEWMIDRILCLIPLLFCFRLLAIFRCAISRDRQFTRPTPHPNYYEAFSGKSKGCRPRSEQSIIS